MLRRIFQQHSKNLSSVYRLRPSLRIFSSDASDVFDEKDLASDYQTTYRTLSHARSVLDSVSRDVIDKKIEHLATKESISTMEENITKTIKAEINQAKSEFHQTQTRHMQWMFGSVGLGGLGLAYRAGLFDSKLQADEKGPKLKPS